MAGAHYLRACAAMLAAAAAIATSAPDRDSPLPATQPAPFSALISLDLGHRAFWLNNPVRLNFLEPLAVSATCEIDEDRYAQARRTALARIRGLLEPAYIPENLETLLEPLPKGMRDGMSAWAESPGRPHDAIRVRYSIDGTEFEIIQDVSRIIVAIRPPAADRAVDPQIGAALIEFVHQVFEDYFQHAPVLQYATVSKLVAKDGVRYLSSRGMTGKVSDEELETLRALLGEQADALVREEMTRELFRPWWLRSEWATDGTTFVLHIASGPEGYTWPEWCTEKKDDEVRAER